MTDGTSGGPTDLATEFEDLKQRLARAVQRAQPTSDNLHFASFEHLDEASITELTRLTLEGRARVEKHRDFFLRHSLYADGMYWYELFLAVSSAVLSFKKAAGHPLPAEVLETIVGELVLISEYSTVQEGDITKRNHEALGNALLVADSQRLTDLAREKARTVDDERVASFTEDTIRRVEGIRQEPTVQPHDSSEENE